MIKYFISYRVAGGLGFGNKEISREDPIRNNDDITGIQEAIREHRIKDGLANVEVLVTNWRRFE